MDIDMNNNFSGEISQFYNEKCVFITGATGFMGKVLVHKLLHSCPGLENLYVLIRPKRDVLPQIRLDKVFEGPLFKGLKEVNPSCFNKVIAINGDITLPSLGMSREDLTTIIEKVSVIFHAAATVRFDEELRKSLIMNVGGTRSIIDIAQKMLNLKALVHVSTAYAHCNNPSTIEEKFYRNHDSPDDIIEKISSTEELDEKALIGEYPNTYTFTKAVAEQLFDKAHGLPVAIIRPSIVVASWEYPMKGWIDNYNGPTGLLAGASTGVLRTMLVKRDCVADLIPVDVAINVMIVSAWKIAQEHNTMPAIYNVTSGSINPITWGQIEDWSLVSIKKFPMSTMLWYPGGSFKKNAHYDLICRWLFLYTPAFLIDVVSTILRMPRWATKLSGRIMKQIEVLQFFTLNEWSWSNHNLNNLQKTLVSTDKNSLKTFDFNIRPLDWRIFLDHYVLGTRHFVFKDHPDTMNSSRKKLKFLYFLHFIVQLSFIFFVVYNLMASIY